MVEPAPRGRNPFDGSGVERGPDEIARYRERPASLVELLRASVDRDAEATALVEVGGESVGYGELWERAARVAGGLRDVGVQRGDRVAIRMANGIDWVLAFFDAQLAGAAVVPVDTRFSEDEVAYVVGDSGAAFVFTDADSGVGELLVRGPNVVRGYWRKPAATAETIVDRWLRTGDLARIDADGLLYVVDRKEEMINAR